jgi:hypothetical protein
MRVHESDDTQTVPADDVAASRTISQEVFDLWGVLCGISEESMAAGSGPVTFAFDPNEPPDLDDVEETATLEDVPGLTVVARLEPPPVTMHTCAFLKRPRLRAISRPRERRSQRRNGATRAGPRREDDPDPPLARRVAA